MKFKVGDRVKAVLVSANDSEYGLKVGDTGKIVRHNGSNVYWVDFINGIFKGKSGLNIDADGTYQMFDFQLELTKDEQEITIRQKGREVIAVMTEDGKYVKSAKAKCSPTDEFDFNIGAKLAFSRLIGEEVKDNHKFKIGDKVRLRPGLVIRHKYDGITLLPSMKHDDVMIVEEASSKNHYFTNIGKIYSAEMLELVTESPFDWEGFKQGKFAVHCDTEEKASRFLNECDNWGIRWENINKKASEFCPRQATYFEYKTGFGGLLWGVKDYFERNGYAVTEYAPTVREVKRPAKVGEWVKIVNARYVPQTDGKDDYKNGDILQVVKYDGYNYEHTKRAYYKNARNKYADGCEYVVLENCQPEAKPFFSQSTIDEISRYTDKELINELSRRWGDKQ